ncbi:MAG: hypothetical protein ACK5SF_16280 [Hyphomonadaceae bacterium]
MKHQKPFLRRDLNSVTGMGLPDWSAGPKGDFGAIIEAAKTAGYAGVQHYFPEHVLAAGLNATGMGRVLTPENAASIAKQHHELGLDATTLYRHALSVTQVGDSQSRGSVNQWRP